MKRLLTAAVLVPLAWLLVWRGSTLLFAGVTGVVALLGAEETARLTRGLGGKVYAEASAVLAAGFCLVFAVPEQRGEWALALLAAACVWTLLRTVLRDGGPVGALSSASGTLFAGLYPGLLFGFLVGIRAAPGERGRAAVFFLLVVVWCADIAAYYLGTALGRRALAPRISPAKTVEGAGAAVLAAALAAEGCRRVFFPEIGLGAAAVGAGLGVVAVLGDLGESVLKRGAGVKDSASLLPGHGGVLDRLDSLALAAPVFYYYQALTSPGG